MLFTFAFWSIHSQGLQKRSLGPRPYLLPWVHALALLAWHPSVLTHLVVYQHPQAARCEFTKDIVSFLKFYPHVCPDLVSFDTDFSQCAFSFVSMLTQKYGFRSQMNCAKLEKTKFEVAHTLHALLHFIECHWCTFVAKVKPSNFWQTWTQLRLKIWKYEPTWHSMITHISHSFIFYVLTVVSWQISCLWKSCENCQPRMSNMLEKKKRVRSRICLQNV